MKKSVSVLFAALLPALALTATNAMAHNDAQEHCYPLAHGENGLGSTNTYHVPFMYANGNGWATWINLTNISDKPINVKLKLRDYQNSPITPNDYQLNFAFNNANSPLEAELSGAILKPSEMGRIGIRNANNRQNFTAQLLWQADACIDQAISGAMRVQYSNSPIYDQGLVLLNGGKPF